MAEDTWWERVEFLHIMALDALALRRPDPQASLVFQGGTCLHLAFGSPRYSEDLDFLTVAATDTAALMAHVHQHVSAACLRRFGVAPTLKASARNERGHNPALFELRLPADCVAEPQTVLKLEFYTVAPDLLARYANRPQPLASTFLPTVRPIIQTADIAELFVDKLHAIEARPYLKARDLFDVWWIRAAGLLPADMADVYDRTATHRAMYPGGGADMDALQRLAVPATALQRELGRFLPASMVTDEMLGTILDTAIAEVRRFQEWTTAGEASRATPPPRMGS